MTNWVWPDPGQLEVIVALFVISVVLFMCQRMAFDKICACYQRLDDERNRRVTNGPIQ